MSYLHGRLGTARPTFDLLADRALGSLAMTQKRVMRQWAMMTPRQRQQALRKAEMMVRSMTPDQQHLYRELLHRQQLNARPDPRQLGAVNWNAVNNGIMAITAVAGTYLTYERMQDEKDARRAERRRADKAAELEAQMFQAELEDRKMAAQRDQEMWEMQKQQYASQQQRQNTAMNSAGIPGKQGMSTTAKVAIGGAAAVGAIALAKM